MKRKSRILFLAAVTIIALVIGGLVLRRVEMLPREDPLFPTPFPTPQIIPSITVTIRPEMGILSQVIGGFLQETASAPEGTKTAPTPSGNATANPAQHVFQLMASAEGTELYHLAQTATALATNPTPSRTSATATFSG